MELTRGAREWQSKGETDRYRGHRIQVFEREGTDPLLLFLHGFPVQLIRLAGFAGA